MSSKYVMIRRSEVDREFYENEIPTYPCPMTPPRPPVSPVKAAILKGLSALFSTAAAVTSVCGIALAVHMSDKGMAIPLVVSMVLLIPTFIGLSAFTTDLRDKLWCHRANMVEHDIEMAKYLDASR